MGAAPLSRGVDLEGGSAREYSGQPDPDAHGQARWKIRGTAHEKMFGHACKAGVLFIYFAIQSTFSMSNTEKHLQDLKEIKDMMRRSSKYLSLSGLSGVFAGAFALAGAALAYYTIYQGQDYMEYRKAYITTESLMHLLLIAAGVLGLSVGSAIWLGMRRAKRQNESFWSPSAALVFINLMIPLTTGGLLCLILLGKGYVGVIAPLTLVFYGLALVNASKYTYTEIRSLGLLEILLGLLAMQFIGYGLIFWALGFGGLHIVYGLLMYRKHGA
jgi:hypothetical protein